VCHRKPGYSNSPAFEFALQPGFIRRIIQKLFRSAARKQKQSFEEAFFKH
jgi:hypothetical protein